MLAVKITPHLQKLIKKYPAIKKQFIPSKYELSNQAGSDDPLFEEKYTVTRGLIYKYPNRALILLTLNCAAYCRFCTRRRSVSDIKKGILTERDLDSMEKYLRRHPEIKELIFSGGDPLTVPLLLKKALKRFCQLPQIKIIRVSTRLHVSDPKQVDSKVLSALKIVKRQPLYLMVHFEHSNEIIKPTIKAIQKLQTASTMLLSQTVSLKGINNFVETLCKLFTRLIEIGVKPYYFLRCDAVKGAKHFMVDREKEKMIFTGLRKRLSGIACPIFVKDSSDRSSKKLIL